MKQKTLLKTMLLLCALVVGGNAWATEEVYYTFTTKASSSNSAYASTYDVTISGLDWNVPGNQYADGGLRIGGKGGSSGTSVSTFNRIITGKSKMGAAITKITFNHGGVSSNNCTVNSVTLTVASKSDFSDGVDYELTPSFSLDTDDSFDFTPTSPATKWDKDSYYKFTINQTIKGSSNVFLLVKSIEFYKEGDASEPSITLGSNTVNAPETAVSTTTINVTYNNLTNYDADVIFYEADGTTEATYDHSWMTAEINATTKNLDYSITANTGAARTAYLRVYALGEEGEAESSLITITQAKKNVATPTFNPEGGSYMQGTGITLTSEGNTIYYTIKTDGTAPSDPTDNSTRYTAPISLSSGTTKIKAIAYDTYGNASSVVTRTYTGIALASLPFSWTGTGDAGKAQLAEETGVVVNLGSDYAASNAPYRLKFDGTNKYVIIYTNEKPETVYFTAKLLGGATSSGGSKIKVQGSADGLTFTDVEEFTINGSNNATFEFTTSNAFANNHRAVKLAMSTLDKNVAVGTISVSCLPVKITAAEYATFSNAHALDFSNTGIKVYTAKDNENSVTLSEVTTGKVPANTPVVLYKAGGATINVPVIASAPAITATNDLRVSDGTTTLSNAYVLAKPDGKDVGFYPWGSSTLSAGKVYLQGVSPTRDFIGIGDASGISNVKVNTNLDGNYYDLQGRQVAQPTKGLYIVNGKKVFVK